MMQPGRETNYPTSSGSVAPTGGMDTALFKLDGVTLTVGMVVLAVVALLIYSVAFKKKLRK